MFQFGFYDVSIEILHVFNRDVGIGLCLLGIAAIAWIVWSIHHVMND